MLLEEPARVIGAFERSRGAAQPATTSVATTRASVVLVRAERGIERIIETIV